MKLKTRLLQGAAPLLCAALLLLLPAIAAAKKSVALTVYGASGKAGESVAITVNMSGIKSLSGVKGFSGAEFELHYDPAAASIKKISKGSIAGSGFMFMENKDFSESSAKVVLAAVSGLITKDGDLCKFTFTLKKDGPVEVSLKEVVIYDQDLRALGVGASSELPPESESSEGSSSGSEPSQDEGRPAGPGGMAVELLPPVSDTPPSGKDSPAKGDGADDPVSGGADESPEGEPSGGAPEDQGSAVAESTLPKNLQKYLWPLLALAIVVAVAAAILFRQRLRK